MKKDLLIKLKMPLSDGCDVMLMKGREISLFVLENFFVNAGDYFFKVKFGLRNLEYKM